MSLYNTKTGRSASLYRGQWTLTEDDCTHYVDDRSEADVTAWLSREWEYCRGCMDIQPAFMGAHCDGCEEYLLDTFGHDYRMTNPRGIVMFEQSRDCGRRM